MVNDIKKAESDGKRENREKRINNHSDEGLRTKN